MIRNLVKSENGQDVVEYAMLASFISTVAVAILETTGISIFMVFYRIISIFTVQS